MRQDDGVQFGRGKLSLGCLNQAAWTGVKQDFSITQAKPGASGSKELANHDESGTSRAQEGDAIGQVRHQ
jgi:hypothetical protein